MRETNKNSINMSKILPHKSSHIYSCEYIEMENISVDMQNLLFTIDKSKISKDEILPTPEVRTSENIEEKFLNPKDQLPSFLNIGNCCRAEDGQTEHHSCVDTDVEILLTTTHPAFLGGRDTIHQSTLNTLMSTKIWSSHIPNPITLNNVTIVMEIPKIQIFIHNSNNSDYCAIAKIYRVGPNMSETSAKILEYNNSDLTIPSTISAVISRSGQLLWEHDYGKTVKNSKFYRPECPKNNSSENWDKYCSRDRFNGERHVFCESTIFMINRFGIKTQNTFSSVSITIKAQTNVIVIRDGKFVPNMPSYDSFGRSIIYSASKIVLSSSDRSMALEFTQDAIIQAALLTRIQQEIPIQPGIMYSVANFCLVSRKWTMGEVIVIYCISDDEYFGSSYTQNPKRKSTLWQRNKNTKFIHKKDLTNSILSLLAALKVAFHKFPVKVHLIDFNDKQFLTPKSDNIGTHNQNNNLFGKSMKNFQKTQILSSSQGKTSPRWINFQKGNQNLNTQNISSSNQQLDKLIFDLKEQLPSKNMEGVTKSSSTDISSKGFYIIFNSQNIDEAVHNYKSSVKHMIPEINYSDDLVLRKIMCEKLIGVALRRSVWGDVLQAYGTFAMLDTFCQYKLINLEINHGSQLVKSKEILNPNHNFSGSKTQPIIIADNDIKVFPVRKIIWDNPHLIQTDTTHISKLLETCQITDTIVTTLLSDQKRITSSSTDTFTTDVDYTDELSDCMHIQEWKDLLSIQNCDMLRKAVMIGDLNIVLGAAQKIMLSNQSTNYKLERITAIREALKHYSILIFTEMWRQETHERDPMILVFMDNMCKLVKMFAADHSDYNMLIALYTTIKTNQLLEEEKTVIEVLYNIAKMGLSSLKPKDIYHLQVIKNKYESFQIDGMCKENYEFIYSQVTQGKELRCGINSEYDSLGNIFEVHITKRNIIMIYAPLNRKMISNLIILMHRSAFITDISKQRFFDRYYHQARNLDGSWFDTDIKDEYIRHYRHNIQNMTLEDQKHVIAQRSLEIMSSDHSFAMDTTDSDHNFQRRFRFPSNNIIPPLDSILPNISTQTLTMTQLLHNIEEKRIPIVIPHSVIEKSVELKQSQFNTNVLTITTTTSTIIKFETDVFTEYKYYRGLDVNKRIINFMWEFILQTYKMYAGHPQMDNKVIADFKVKFNVNQQIAETIIISAKKCFPIDTISEVTAETSNMETIPGNSIVHPHLILPILPQSSNSTLPILL